MLAVDHEGVRPDVVILGKSLSGGLFPVSCVLADDEVMLTIRPGQHGSTFGGSPLAGRVGIASMEVLREEGMVENAAAMEGVLRRELSQLDPSVVHTLRGRGLFFAVVITANPGFTAWDVCLKLRDRGLLAKPTHDDIIRLSPPLIITEEQLVEACGIVRSVLNRETD
jgi:ornithine--oxo-acid transaminase